MARSEHQGTLQPRRCRVCGTPPIDVRVFPDVRVKEEDANLYWTTSKLGVAGLVYYVDLATGNADAHSRGFTLAVRLVRSRP